MRKEGRGKRTVDQKDERQEEEKIKKRRGKRLLLYQRKERIGSLRKEGVERSGGKTNSTYVCACVTD